MGSLLVVFDDSMTRKFLGMKLAPMGYKVLEAEDGVEALLIWQALNSEIALVLMDINIPRMDGITSARAIKTSDPAAKVILISWHYRYLLHEVPADAFLYKPFFIKEWVGVVQKVLGEDQPAPFPG